jgi:hypothetical protein
MDASARSGEPGIEGGTAGFSWNSRTRSRSSTPTMPNRRPSVTGISSVARVASAFWSRWYRSILE